MKHMKKLNEKVPQFHLEHSCHSRGEVINLRPPSLKLQGFPFPREPKTVAEKAIELTKYPITSEIFVTRKTSSWDRRIWVLNICGLLSETADVYGFLIKVQMIFGLVAAVNHGCCCQKSVKCLSVNLSLKVKELVTLYTTLLKIKVIFWHLWFCEEPLTFLETCHCTKGSL